jgi:hypothetical protein
MMALAGVAMAYVSVVFVDVERPLVELDADVVEATVATKGGGEGGEVEASRTAAQHCLSA